MRIIGRAVLLIIVLTGSALGQSPPPIDRLPLDTVFFFAWHGSAAIEKGRATSALLRLWDDPEMVAARQVLMERAARESTSAEAAGDILSTDRPEEALKLIRLALASSITSESVEGNTTVLAVTSSYRDEKSGAQRKRFNYVGVTPKMIILAPRKAQLREAVARVTAQQGPAAGGLASDSTFLQARNRLPHPLTALSYSDFSRIPWQAALEAVLKQAGEKDKLTPREQDALRAVFRVLPRYLHTAFGGYWKDRNGIFMESYIE